MANIQGVFGGQIPPVPSANVKQLANTFRTHIDGLSQALRDLQNNQSLSESPVFLKELQEHIIGLAEVAKQTNGV